MTSVELCHVEVLNTVYWPKLREKSSLFVLTRLIFRLDSNRKKTVWGHRGLLIELEVSSLYPFTFERYILTKRLSVFISIALSKVAVVFRSFAAAFQL